MKYLPLDVMQQSFNYSINQILLTYLYLFLAKITCYLVV